MQNIDLTEKVEHYTKLNIKSKFTSNPNLDKKMQNYELKKMYQNF